MPTDGRCWALRADVWPYTFVCCGARQVVAWDGLFSRPFSGISVNPPTITGVDSDDFEVGENLTYELSGVGFGGEKSSLPEVRVGDRSPTRPLGGLAADLAEAPRRRLQR